MNTLTSLDARLVIGHRGNAAHAPENTLESFAQAVALGVDALELDIRLTRDGVPVVIHDSTLDRTTNRSGEVASVSLDLLRHADAGAWFSPDNGASFPYRGRGLTVPTFAEVLAAFPRTPILIEVKVPEAAMPIAEVLARAGAAQRVVLASMQLDAVAPLRRLELATGASGAEVKALLSAAILRRRPSELPYDALCIPQWYNGVPVPVPALARLARPAGVVTHVWTVDDPRIAQELWTNGVQGIVTNDPAIMIEARDAR